MKPIILLMFFAALMGYCLMPRVMNTRPETVEIATAPVATPVPATPIRRTPIPATPATPKPWGSSLDQGAYNKTHGYGVPKIIRPKMN